MNIKEILALPIDKRLAIIVNWVNNNPITASEWILEELQYKEFEERILDELEKRSNETISKLQLNESK